MKTIEQRIPIKKMKKTSVSKKTPPPLPKINNKIPVIWALFDDSYCSYKKAVKTYFDGFFVVYSIGINDLTFKEKKNYFYKKIDLSLLNRFLLQELRALPSPDIILASPPCESWSTADCNGRMIREIGSDGKWVVKNRAFYEKYNKTCSPSKKRFFIQKESARILGEATIGATVMIIETFKPKIWVIENPQTSKIWEFQKNHWHFDGKIITVNYSTYDPTFSAKPTTFKSNFKLELNVSKTPGNNEHMAKGNYSKRSSIPIELTKEIINQAKIAFDNENFTYKDDFKNKISNRTAN